MKALTVKQPWAYLIAAGLKDVENRTWRTKYRGRFLIHTSKKPCAFLDFVEMLKWWVWVNLQKAGIDSKFLRSQPNGFIIGSAELVDCVEDYPSDWAMGDCIHWIVKNPLMYKNPIPCKGGLSLWNYNGELPEEEEYEKSKKNIASR